MDAEMQSDLQERHLVRELVYEARFRTLFSPLRFAERQVYDYGLFLQHPGQTPGSITGTTSMRSSSGATWGRSPGRAA